MSLINTAREAMNFMRNPTTLVNMIWDEFTAMDNRIDDVEAGTVAAGSISSDELANGAVIEAKLGTGAVTSGKIGAGAVTAAKLSGELKSGSGAGYTIALVTTAFGDPATLSDAFTGIYKDTAATKYYVIVVFDDIFVAEELTAVPAA